MKRLAGVMVTALSFYALDPAAGASIFSVSLATDKGRYVLGEPVILSSTIVYHGGSALEVNNPLDPGDYKLKLEVGFGATGDYKRLYTWQEALDARIDRSRLPSIRLRPGAQVKSDIILFCRWLDPNKTNRLVFPQAGSYRIRYTVSLGTRTSAGTTTILVSEPRQTEDREAWVWLQKQDKVLLEEFGGLDHLAEVPEARARVLTHLQALLTRYPKSVHAKYVRRFVSL